VEVWNDGREAIALDVNLLSFVLPCPASRRARVKARAAQFDQHKHDWNKMRNKNEIDKTCIDSAQHRARR
jgi:uncharacterized protein